MIFRNLLIALVGMMSLILPLRASLAANVLERLEQLENEQKCASTALLLRGNHLENQGGSKRIEFTDVDLAHPAERWKDNTFSVQCAGRYFVAIAFTRDASDGRLNNIKYMDDTYVYAYVNGAQSQAGAYVGESRIMRAAGSGTGILTLSEGDIVEFRSSAQNDYPRFFRSLNITMFRLSP